MANTEQSRIAARSLPRPITLEEGAALALIRGAVISGDYEAMQAAGKLLADLALRPVASRPTLAGLSSRQLVGLFAVWAFIDGRRSKPRMDRLRRIEKHAQSIIDAGE